MFEIRITKKIKNGLKPKELAKLEEPSRIYRKKKSLKLKTQWKNLNKADERLNEQEDRP